MTSKHYRPPVNSSESLVVFAFPVTQFAVVSYSLKYAVTHRVTSRTIVIGVLVFHAYSFLSSSGYPNIEEFLLTCFCTRLFRTLSYHFIYTLFSPHLTFKREMTASKMFSNRIGLHTQEINQRHIQQQFPRQLLIHFLI